MFDRWLWPEEPVTRLEKSTQHLTPNTCIPYRALYAWRIFGCVMMWAQFIFTTAADFIAFGRPQASYFALWGIYLGTLVYSLLLIAHCRYPHKKVQNTHDDSMWHLWKWCLFLLVLYFHWQLLNTGTYWLIIYWDIKDSLALQSKYV